MLMELKRQYILFIFQCFTTLYAEKIYAVFKLFHWSSFLLKIKMGMKLKREKMAFSGSREIVYACD